MVQVSDQDKLIEQSISSEAKERLNDIRLSHLLKYVEVRGKAYLKLVTDAESLEAFEIIMDNFTRATWFQFSWIPMDAVPPTVPFAEPQSIQLQRDRLRANEQDWVIEAYRRLDSILHPTIIPEASAPRRRGYRAEVKAWMKDRQLTSQKQAAKRLGVSLDILKSIMSDKGRLRCSNETLMDVLGKIGYKPDD